MRHNSPAASDISLRRDDSLLVCFSHLRWDFVWQRPQHLLSRAAKDYRVLFIEEPIHERDAQPRMDVSHRDGNVRIARPILAEGTSPRDAIRIQREFTEALLSRERSARRVFWYYTPMALAFSAHLPCDACIYDNMDELSAFNGASPEMLDREDELFARADVIFTGGMSLYEAKRSRHPAVHCMPSSITVDHFATARWRKGADPEDQAALQHPRIGYFGVIDERLDVGLIAEAARLRPRWSFVMIGPVVKIDPAVLPRPHNIHWLGPKSYGDLPRYLAQWDVGLMPFAMNEATRFISPTKTPEFLAAGVPVVSTPIRDVVRPYGEAGLVEIASTGAEIVACAEALLARTARERSAWLGQVDRHLATTSWDRTWSRMSALIDAELEIGAPVLRRASSSMLAAAAPAE